MGRVSHTAIKHPVFVANDTAGTRRDTAVLLVGTAREFKIHQRAIQSTHNGYWITDELADVLYDEGVTDEVSGNDAVEPEPEPNKKTSGNRAAKNKPTDKE